MFEDLMDDFVFGPMNLIGRAVGAIRSAMRRSRSRRTHKHAASATVRVAIPRPDKGGKVAALDVIKHVQRWGVDVVGGREAATHDARNIYIVIPMRQLEWYRWLYNDGELRTPKRGWRKA